jgi:hypothetical protein
MHRRLNIRTDIMIYYSRDLLQLEIIPPNHLVNQELPAHIINSISILPLHSSKALISHLTIPLNQPSLGTI